MTGIACIFNITWAEFVRRWWMVIRYPVDYFTGIISLYLLFVGVFYGVAGNFGQAAPGLDRTLDSLVLGTCMWFFSIAIMNQVRVILEMEAVTGTLEQLFLVPYRFVVILMVRSITGFVFAFLAVAILLVLIMATTGRWLSFPILPAILVLVLAALGIQGVALIMGGLSLVFKRLGQLNMIVQFGFLFLAFPPIENLTPGWQTVAYTFPLSRGMTLLRGLVVDGWQWTDQAVALNLASLVFNSVIYLVIGWLFYLASERIAKDHGLLGHY